MVYCLQSREREDHSAETRLWSSEPSGAFIRGVFPLAEFRGGSVFLAGTFWDCVGDLLLGAMAEEKRNGGAAGLQSVYIFGPPSCGPAFYSAESLISSYITMKEKGWLIYMYDESNMFYVECPAFDGAMAQVPAPAAAFHSYAHPIDSGVIRILDLPGVKMLFGSAADMLADVSYGEVIASGIPADEQNFPEINEIINRCAAVLGIKRPYVVVSSSLGLNAYTVGSDEEPFIVLGSILVRVMSLDKLAFVIGHECGHIAMGHVVYHSVVNTAGAMSAAIPVIGPLVFNASALALRAWSRRSEITADRAGLLCCGSTQTAKSALMQLTSGYLDADKVDIDSYIQNSKGYRRHNALRKVGGFLQYHPMLPKRMEAIELFANSETYYRSKGLPVPDCAIPSAQLTKAVEKIIAVLGEE